MMIKFLQDFTFGGMVSYAEGQTAEVSKYLADAAIAAGAAEEVKKSEDTKPFFGTKKGGSR